MTQILFLKVLLVSAVVIQWGFFFIFILHFTVFYECVLTEGKQFFFIQIETFAAHTHKALCQIVSPCLYFSPLLTVSASLYREQAENNGTVCSRLLNRFHYSVQVDFFCILICLFISQPRKSFLKGIQSFNTLILYVLVLFLKFVLKKNMYWF